MRVGGRVYPGDGHFTLFLGGARLTGNIGS